MTCAANGNDTEGLDERLEALGRVLGPLGRVAVALSGGVDSTLLLEVARTTPGADPVAVSARLRSTPAADDAWAAEYCASRGVERVVVEVDELAIPGFPENPPNRCYLCKRTILRALSRAAAERGATLVEGSNADDMGAWRPGLAAVRELGVASPLAEAGLRKGDVRALARRLGLPCWDRPSSACLASRFAFGQRIDAQALRRVDAAEGLLRSLGLTQVRVRVHRLGDAGDLARVEVLPRELPLLAGDGVRGRVEAGLRDLGFSFVTADLAGFRSGSMEATLPPGARRDQPGPAQLA